MFEIKKDITFSYNGKQDKLPAGCQISQQELIEKLGEDNVSFLLNQEDINVLRNNPIPVIIDNATLDGQAIEKDEMATQETTYRFEKSGYKKEDGSAFRKNSIYSESEIKQAGLDIDALLKDEAILWLK